MKTLNIVERIEGEAKLVCNWENEKIENAQIQFLNFRGFEYILENKPALDALIYTPRICGICGQAHLKATAEALENIYKVSNEPLEITNKAKLLREIGLNIEIIDSHLKWFYIFIMPDIAKLSKDNKYSKYQAIKGESWRKGTFAASESIKALAVFAGQWPHSSYMIPGGVMSDPTLFDLISMENYLDQTINFLEKELVGIDIDDYLNMSDFSFLYNQNSALKDFKDLCFKNDLENIGKSYNRHIVLSSNNLFKAGRIELKNRQAIDLSLIEEKDLNSFKVNEKRKANEYTWAKTALYNNKAYETGPLSRALLKNRKLIKNIHKKFNDSVFTRVFARMDELVHLVYTTKKLIKQIDISEESYIKPNISLDELGNVSAKSVVEAARGSLLHNITIDNGIIKKYDVITPSVWNLGPGINNNLGVAQNAIIGANSIEKAHIILRSFDVCSVCTTQ
ncbi:nickel-dependent hydrogenase large subunit [Arcobacter sp. CECT 8985]|uniref:nickel-dependent hydrogenase large subunit n=1 Tax=Arcobacter sp. CECT 8985 TaxID=1935424 RepID=UPI00100B41BF|nr:nickel-dependent hydrogenase large subunit [Arcobacter sp. CECT 8985]RXJ88165.1 Ni/Fe hydrogenase [Arcobacter sp. CECT 8985]